MPLSLQSDHSPPEGNPYKNIAGEFIIPAEGVPELSEENSSHNNQKHGHHENNNNIFHYL